METRSMTRQRKTMEEAYGKHQADLPTPPNPPPKPKLNLPGYQPGLRLPRPSTYTELLERISMLDKQVTEQAEMIVRVSQAKEKQKAKRRFLEFRCMYLEKTLAELSNQDKVKTPEL